MKIAMMLAVNMPLMTTVPRMRRAAAPEPEANHKGHAPQNEGERSHQNRPQSQAELPRGLLQPEVCLSRTLP